MKLSLISDVEGWKTRQVRVNTRVMYATNKYNLFREETEGYAKLVTLLNGFAKGKLSIATVPAAAAEIRALTGHFLLDPNKVIDVILASFERQPDNTAFVALLKHPMFNPRTVPQVLGKRLQGVAADPAHAPPKDDTEGGSKPAVRPAVHTFEGRAPLRVAARLIQGGMFGVEEVYPHLGPADSELVEAHAAARKAAAEAASKAGTSGVSSVLRESSLAARIRELNADDVVAAALAAMPPCDQKAAFVAQLLDVGLLDEAAAIMRRLHAQKVQLMMWPEVAAGMCRCLEAATEPFHRALCRGDPRRNRSILDDHQGPSSWPSYAEAAKDVGPLLAPSLLDTVKACGMRIHLSPLLLPRVCEVLRHVLLSECAPSLLCGAFPNSTDPSDPGLAAALARQAQVEEVLLSCVFPALALTPASVAASSEAWGVLRLLPYPSRYRLYAEASVLPALDPVVASAVERALQEIRREAKRFKVVRGGADREDARKASEEANAKARMVAKAAHGVPVQAAELLVEQLESYPLLLDPIVTAVAHLTPLGMDTVLFALLRRLSSSKQALADAGGGLRERIEALGTMVGRLVRRAHEWKLDVAPAIHYVVHRLKKGVPDAVTLARGTASAESTAVNEGTSLLSRVLSEVSGLASHEAMGEKMLAALGGGPALLASVSTTGTRAFIAATRHLIDALCAGEREEERALQALVVLAGQLRDVVCSDGEIPGLKCRVELTDEALHLQTQLMRFLHQHMPWARLQQVRGRGSCVDGRVAPSRAILDEEMSSGRSRGGCFRASRAGSRAGGRPPVACVACCTPGCKCWLLR